MIHHELVRSYLPDRTIGFIQGEFIEPMATMELPWLKNKVNESCIPEGTYIVRPDATGRMRYYRFDYVPNRTHIEVHPAADVHHLLGCQAYGKKFTSQYHLMESEEAMKEYVEKCAGQTVVLTVRSFNPATDLWPKL